MTLFVTWFFEVLLSLWQENLASWSSFNDGSNGKVNIIFLSPKLCLRIFENIFLLQNQTQEHKKHHGTT